MVLGRVFLIILVLVEFCLFNTRHLEFKVGLGPRSTIILNSNLLSYCSNIGVASAGEGGCCALWPHRTNGTNLFFEFGKIIQ